MRLLYPIALLRHWKRSGTRYRVGMLVVRMRIPQKRALWRRQRPKLHETRNYTRSYNTRRYL